MVNRKLFSARPLSRTGTPMMTVSEKRVQQTANLAGKAINSQQAKDIIKQNPKIAPIVEMFNPSTNSYHRISNGVNMLNSMLPPDKRINSENIVKFAENAFKGIKTPKAGEMSVMNGSYGLSKAPNPRPVSLNSGVAPTCYANDFMNPVLDSCSPMHMSSVIMGIPTTTSSVLGDYLQKTIAFDIQTRAQANINFNLDLTTAFSAAQIISSMNDVIRALQVYYFYASILSYESDTRNKNAAMISLRNSMTSQQISDVTSLGRRLEDTPCPPRIVQWVRYLSMNYLSGDTQGASILKIGHIYNFETDTTLLASSLATLSTVANTNTFVLMRRAIPQWRIGTLYDVPAIPVYDKNFLTIFANLQAVTYDNVATQYITPTVSNSASTIMYNSYNNRLDGAAYAMITPSYSGSAGFLTASSAASIGSRKSYYFVGSAGWYLSAAYSFLSVSRPETYKLLTPASASLLKLHLPGAEMCQGVSGDSIVQTSKNFADFLFNIQSISSVGKLTSFNKRGNNQI
nr:MAG: hypothetical protein H4Bulk46395_000002 [Partitiviridae sp.]